MAQKLILPGGSPAAYTMGGIRVWFNRLVDPDAVIPKYEGFRDLGNVIDAPVTPIKQIKEHFSARQGRRRRDYKLTEVLGEDVDIQFDELSFDNLKNWWMGDIWGTSGTTTIDVAAGTGTGSVAGEVIQLIGTEIVPLSRGLNAGTIVVSDFATGATPFTVTTDYVVVNNVNGQQGWKGIQRVGGGTITTGTFVRVAYVYDVIAHKQLSPYIIDSSVMIGQMVMFCVSRKGVEFFRRINYAELESDGAFNYVFENWTNAKFKVRVESDDIANPTMPFGVLEYYGVGAKMWNGGV